MTTKYVTRRIAVERIGVHFNTLYAMAERGDIETVTVGKQKKYNVEKYMRKIKENEQIKRGDINEDEDEDNDSENEEIRRRICYCRVSSQKQKEDLTRQITMMKLLYPEYEIITDIGSGLNFERPGLKKIIDYAIKGEIAKIVVAYKDRLARIGYELIENIIRDYSKSEIEIINKEEEETPEEEITKDIIAIMNVYTAKLNGKRKYNKKVRKIES
jgi:putative resolvase